MDYFFEHLPWFVPFAKYDIVDRHARENELRRGKFVVAHKLKGAVLTLKLLT